MMMMIVIIIIIIIIIKYSIPLAVKQSTKYYVGTILYRVIHKSVKHVRKLADATVE